MGGVRLSPAASLKNKKKKIESGVAQKPGCSQRKIKTHPVIMNSFEYIKKMLNQMGRIKRGFGRGFYVVERLQSEGTGQVMQHGWSSYRLFISLNGVCLGQFLI